MKHLKTLLLAAIFTLGLSGVVNAQKTAHINSDLLLSAMPETKALQSELEKLKTTYRSDIEGMYKKLEAKVKKYEAEGPTQTPEVNQKRAIEVQQDRAKIGQAEQVMNQDMGKRYQAKTLPILEKAQNAIKAVASEKGIVYVLDSAPGKGLIVFDKGEDILAAVKAKLGF